MNSVPLFFVKILNALNSFMFAIVSGLSKSPRDTTLMFSFIFPWYNPKCWLAVIIPVFFPSSAFALAESIYVLSNFIRITFKNTKICCRCIMSVYFIPELLVSNLLPVSSKCKCLIYLKVANKPFFCHFVCYKSWS